MPLEAAFQDLVVQCRILYDILLGLRLTVVEDKPLTGDVVLVDTFGDAADELLGWLAEALQDATEGQQATGYPVEVDRARRALTHCQERCNRLRHRYAADLVSYERIAELLSVGRERQGEWLAWAHSVKAALDQCQQPLYDVDDALFLCWQEIAERVRGPCVSGPPLGITRENTVPVRGCAAPGETLPQADDSERPRAHEECLRN